MPNTLLSALSVSAILFIAGIKTGQSGDFMDKYTQRETTASSSRSEGTREKLAEALQRLMQRKALSGITIGELTGTASLSRKSFYYHFADKEQLVRWMLARDLEKILSSSVSSAWEALEILCHHFGARRESYRNLMDGPGAKEMSRLLCPFFGRLLEKEGAACAGDDFARFFASSVMMVITWWLQDCSEEDAAAFLLDLRHHAIRLSEYCLLTLR